MASRLVFIFFLLLSFVSAQNVLQNMKIEDSTLKLKFKKDVEKKDLRAQIITTKNLTKYVFDFKNCKLAKGVKSIKNLDGKIKSIRVAQFKPTVVRVVVDSKKPYILRYSQRVNSTFNISLPLKKGSKKSANSKSNKDLKISNLFNQNLNSSNSKSSKTMASGVLLNRRYKIVIDPGHGGKKPGTQHGGIKEKDLVLQISKRLYRKLKKMGFNVKMTRYNDKTVGLLKRARVANKFNADVFVSIHANSVKYMKDKYKGKGVMTLFLSKNKSGKAKNVAARENKDILDSMDKATKDVLLNAVFTGPKIVLSNKLALDVQRNMLINARRVYKDVPDAGVRGQSLYVLVGAQMPAILVEVGYLSHPVERKRLLNPTYQEQIVKGIADGIVNFLKNRERELE